MFLPRLILFVTKMSITLCVYEKIRLARLKLYLLLHVKIMSALLTTRHDRNIQCPYGPSQPHKRKLEKKKERTADTHTYMHYIRLMSAPIIYVCVYVHIPATLLRSKEKTGSNLALINPRHTWRGFFVKIH